MTARPAWSQTLPRELVHRAAIAEVFLTSLSSRQDPDSFAVGAQWPRAHPFFRPDQLGRHDPMLIAESLRQAGLAVAHRCYNVPFGFQFIMCDMHFTVIDPELMAVDAKPTDLVLNVTCSDIRRKAGVLRGTRVALLAHREGAALAEAWANMRCLPGDIYSRRCSRAVAEPIGPADMGPPVEPGLVGRRDPIDVLLAQPVSGSKAGLWPLRADRNHPTLFDHPLDHLPGMAQLEAARQAALAFSSTVDRAPLLTGCHASFHAAAFLERESWLQVASSPATTGATGAADDEIVGEQDGAQTIKVTISNDGIVPVSTVTLTLTPSTIPTRPPPGDALAVGAVG